MSSDWWREWRDFMDANPAGSLIEVNIKGEWVEARRGVDNSTIYFETGIVPVQLPGEGAHNQSRFYPRRLRAKDAVRRLGELLDEG
jgi:hypothetical protein